MCHVIHNLSVLAQRFKIPVTASRLLGLALSAGQIGGLSNTVLPFFSFLFSFRYTGCRMNYEGNSFSVS